MFGFVTLVIAGFVGRKFYLLAEKYERFPWAWALSSAFGFVTLRSIVLELPMNFVAGYDLDLYLNIRFGYSASTTIVSIVLAVLTYRYLAKRWASSNANRTQKLPDDILDRPL